MLYDCTLLLLLLLLLFALLLLLSFLVRCGGGRRWVWVRFRRGVASGLVVLSSCFWVVRSCFGCGVPRVKRSRKDKKCSGGFDVAGIRWSQKEGLKSLTVACASPSRSLTLRAMCRTLRGT